MNIYEQIEKDIKNRLVIIRKVIEVSPSAEKVILQEAKLAYEAGVEAGIKSSVKVFNKVLESPDITST